MSEQQAVAIVFSQCYGLLMARKTTDLKALHEMIEEAHDITRTVVLPDQRSRRLFEILSAALQLSAHLLETPPAATLGAKGGKVTAQRGSDYFRKIAQMRKERKCGRPPKSVQ